MSASHRFVDHTSEVELVLEADTLPELFCQTASALAELMLGDAPNPPGLDQVTVRVTVRSFDLPTLLVDWTNELIYQTETRQAVWSEIADLQLGASDIAAELRGLRQPELALQVKAATLHDAVLEAAAGGWKGHLVLDV
jgi:SHS2 domain-containing protein